MVAKAGHVNDTFEGEEGYGKTVMAHEERSAAKDAVFEKGQSKRIWGELYKVCFLPGDIVPPLCAVSSAFPQ